MYCGKPLARGKPLQRFLLVNITEQDADVKILKLASWFSTFSSCLDETHRSLNMELNSKIQLEWLIVADAAQAANGKLNLLGGGLESFGAPGFPLNKPIGIALALQVPWMLTNRRHTAQLEVADQDGQQLFKIEGPVEVGRPAGIPIGQSQRFSLVVDGVVPFPKPGTYVIVARVDGEECGRTVFNVLQIPAIRAA